MTLRCVNRNEIVKKSNVVGGYGAKEAINTGKLSKILLCHPELVSGSSHRNIIPTKEKINNITSTSCTAQRQVSGDYVPQKESTTGWLVKILGHRDFISGSNHRDIGSITESLINHRHIEPPTEGLLLCKYSEQTFLHNRELIKANVSEERELDSEPKSGNAEAFQSIKRSNQRHKALKLNSKFFFFGSLFHFSSPKKEKVNKEQTISKVLSDKLKRKVRGGYAPRNAAFTLAKVFSPFYLSPRRIAFTLAEVLITLGIIGVVAAMTLPTLIQKYQDKELANQVRKVYSDINNAAVKAQSDFALPGDNSGLFNPSNTHLQTAQNFIKYFNGAKLCESRSKQYCKQYYYDIKYANKYTKNNLTTTAWQSAYPTIILNNGAILHILQRHNENCYALESYVVKDEYGSPVLDADGNEQIRSSPVHLCATIVMDVNGIKRPNRYGQDVYDVMIYKNKISPSYQKHTGSESFKNILYGKDKFIYTDYQPGAEMN